MRTRVCIQFNARKTPSDSCSDTHTHTRAYVRTHTHILFPFGACTTSISHMLHMLLAVLVRSDGRAVREGAVVVYTMAYMYALIELVATSLLIHARRRARAVVCVCVLWS